MSAGSRFGKFSQSREIFVLSHPLSSRASWISDNSYT
jgi:hypothetical protein